MIYFQGSGGQVRRKSHAPKAKKKKKKKKVKQNFIRFFINPASGSFYSCLSALRYVLLLPCFLSKQKYFYTKTL
jgi:hypothetical protein